LRTSPHPFLTDSERGNQSDRCHGSMNNLRLESMAETIRCKYDQHVERFHPIPHITPYRRAYRHLRIHLLNKKNCGSTSTTGLRPADSVNCPVRTSMRADVELGAKSPRLQSRSLPIHFNDCLAAQSVIACSASMYVTHHLNFPSHQLLSNPRPNGTLAEQGNVIVRSLLEAP
jgi:hypothetical protein